MPSLKVLTIGALVGVNGQDANRKNLDTLLDHYNKVWDVSTNYWVEYGCNCRGDLDRTANGNGSPVDGLDKNCKSWKQCMKCSECEDVTASKYVVRKRRGDYYCKDEVGTCERALCECDLQFARDSGNIAGDWTSDNWGETGFDAATCSKNQGGNFDGQCCVAESGLATWYNANKMCCSADGSVLPIGTCL